MVTKHNSEHLSPERIKRFKILMVEIKKYSQVNCKKVKYNNY